MQDENMPNDEARDRFEQHQRHVADKERANRIKAQDLIQRERKLEDEQRLIAQERKILEQTREALIGSRRRRSAFILPLLLAAAVGAGLFAFENIEQQKRYYQQVTEATKNIDTLAKILSITQDEVVLTTSKLSNKQFELERTKDMLSELRDTTDRLQTEISQLRQSDSTSVQEKDALTLSADTLSTQLYVLRTQLEDKYLTNDINEVYIQYQENDLRKAQQALEEKENRLSEQSKLLAEKEQELLELQQALAQKPAL